MSRVYDRVPNLRDDRDWRAADFLGARALAAGADPLAAVDVALAALVAKKYTASTTKAWAKAITAWAHSTIPLPAPAPPKPPKPVPTPQAQRWLDKWQLDQGETGHCVGFGWAQRVNTAEAIDGDEMTFAGFTNADAHDIYYRAKVIDGEPGLENGSSTRSGAKAVQQLGKIKNYAFALTTAEITSWVLAKGPVVVGTNWYEGMETPDARGLVSVSGAVLGGHEYVIDGVEFSLGVPEYVCQNSWGTSWGDHGYFRIKVTDFATLLAADGDACVTVEA